MRIRIAFLLLASLAPGTVATAQCPLVEVALHTPAFNHHLGRSSDLDGDVAVLGAPSFVDDAYVFERSEGDPGAWRQVARLSHPSIVGGTSFGDSVAVSGDTVLVGAPDLGGGCALVFERDAGGPGAWGFATELVPSELAPSYFYGEAVDLDGDRAVVGRILLSGTEDAVFVFERQAGAWSEVAKLTASEPTQGLFGYSLALCGDSLLVGTDYHERAYLFERDGTGTWQQTQSFSDPTWPGTFYTGFSWSVALTDSYAAIGQPSWYPGGIGVPHDLGAVHVFERDLGGQGSWGYFGRLTEPLQASGNEFGTGLALDGDRLAVGAPDNSEVATQHGAVYVYERLGGAWTLMETPQAPSLGTLGYNLLGYSLAMQGQTLVAGAPSWSGIGSAVFFGEPTSETYCTAGVSASGCTASISTSGTPSSSAPSGFALLATEVEGGKRGLFFFGANGRQAAPWGNSTSFQCVVPPVARTPLFQENGTTGACDGAYTFDLNAYFQAKPALDPGAGALVQAQFWYRDPFAENYLKTCLSNAVEFTVCP